MVKKTSFLDMDEGLRATSSVLLTESRSVAKPRDFRIESRIEGLLVMESWRMSCSY